MHMKADAIKKTKGVVRIQLNTSAVVPLYAMGAILQISTPKKVQGRFYNLTAIQINIRTTFRS